MAVRNSEPRPAAPASATGKQPPRGRDTPLAPLFRNRGSTSAAFWNVYHLLPDSTLVKRRQHSLTHKRRSHTFIISLSELAFFSTWQLWVRYERWSDYETTGKRRKRRQRHQKKRKRKKNQKEINRAGDTMTINVWPVINISLHHCSLRRTKCKGEQDEKFIIFWHSFGIYRCKTKHGWASCACYEICGWGREGD